MTESPSSSYVSIGIAKTKSPSVLPQQFQLLNLLSNNVGEQVLQQYHHLYHPGQSSSSVIQIPSLSFELDS